MKKLLIVLITAFSLLSLSGCSVSNADLKEAKQALLDSKHFTQTTKIVKTEDGEKGESIYTITVLDNVVYEKFEYINYKRYGSDERVNSVSETYYDFDNNKLYEKEPEDEKFEVSNLLSYYELSDFYDDAEESYDADNFTVMIDFDKVDKDTPEEDAIFLTKLTNESRFFKTVYKLNVSANGDLEFSYESTDKVTKDFSANIVSISTKKVNITLPVVE